MARKKNTNGMGSLRKKTVKGKTYFEGRYWDPILHKQKSVSATTEAECKRKLQHALAAITMGTFVTPERITVEQWLRQWHDGRKDTLQPASRRAYENQMNLRIIPAIGRVKLQDLRRVHCQTILDNERKKGVSRATLRMCRTVMNAAFADAVRLEMVHRNPASDLIIPEAEYKEPVAMDDDLIRAFTSAAASSPYFRVFMLQLETGTRISEILGLQWRSVDLKTGEVQVVGQLETKDGKPHFKPRTKTGKDRTLYLPPYAIAYLKEQKRQQNENRLRAGDQWHNDDGLVFTREDGSPLVTGSVNSAFKRICTELGHPELTPHALRRTFVSREIAAGTDVKTVSALVGHSSIDITLTTYAATTEDRKREAAARRQQRHDKEKPDT